MTSERYQKKEWCGIVTEIVDGQVAKARGQGESRSTGSEPC